MVVLATLRPSVGVVVAAFVLAALFLALALGMFVLGFSRRTGAAGGYGFGCLGGMFGFVGLGWLVLAVLFLVLARGNAFDRAVDDGDLRIEGQACAASSEGAVIATGTFVNDTDEAYRVVISYEFTFTDGSTTRSNVASADVPARSTKPDLVLDGGTVAAGVAVVSCEVTIEQGTPPP